MIIDLILDRKDGVKYNAREFYQGVMGYGEIWPDLADPITRAMDGGEEEDVQRELCNYVTSQDYNPDICNYIRSVKWID